MRFLVWLRAWVHESHSNRMLLLINNSTIAKYLHKVKLQQQNAAKVGWPDRLAPNALA